MGFQILNNQGEPISMGDLDREAAAFWNKEVHARDYANPSVIDPNDDEITRTRKETRGNWFDTIGYCIHSQGNECGGWANVVATMIVSSIGMKFIDTSTGYKGRPVKVPEFVNDGAGQIHLPDEVEIRIWGVLEYYKPYIALINHWQTKGYSPIKVRD